MSRRTLRTTLAAVVLGLAITPAVASAAPPVSDKMLICHATNSVENPFLAVTLDAEGVYTRHFGEKHQDGMDIIPPFDYDGQRYSQNWNPVTQAIHDAGCLTKGGVDVPAEGNGFGSALVVLGSLPVVAGAFVYTRRRRNG